MNTAVRKLHAQRQRRAMHGPTTLRRLGNEAGAGLVDNRAWSRVNAGLVSGINTRQRMRWEQGPGQAIQNKTDRPIRQRLKGGARTGKFNCSGNFDGGMEWGELRIFQEGSRIWGRYSYEVQGGIAVGTLSDGSISGENAKARYAEKHPDGGQPHGRVWISEGAGPGELTLAWQNDRHRKKSSTTIKRKGRSEGGDRCSSVMSGLFHDKSGAWGQVRLSQAVNRLWGTYIYHPGGTRVVGRIFAGQVSGSKAHAEYHEGKNTRGSLTLTLDDKKQRRLRMDWRNFSSGRKSSTILVEGSQGAGVAGKGRENISDAGEKPSGKTTDADIFALCERAGTEYKGDMTGLLELLLSVDPLFVRSRYMRHAHSTEADAAYRFYRHLWIDAMWQHEMLMMKWWAMISGVKAYAPDRFAVEIMKPENYGPDERARLRVFLTSRYTWGQCKSKVRAIARGMKVMASARKKKGGNTPKGPFAKAYGKGLGWIKAGAGTVQIALPPLASILAKARPPAGGRPGNMVDVARTIDYWQVGIGAAMEVEGAYYDAWITICEDDIRKARDRGEDYLVSSAKHTLNLWQKHKADFIKKGSSLQPLQSRIGAIRRKAELARLGTRAAGKPRGSAREFADNAEKQAGILDECVKEMRGMDSGVVAALNTIAGRQDDIKRADALVKARQEMEKTGSGFSRFWKNASAAIGGFSRRLKDAAMKMDPVAIATIALEVAGAAVTGGASTVVQVVVWLGKLVNRVLPITNAVTAVVDMAEYFDPGLFKRLFSIKGLGRMVIDTFFGENPADRIQAPAVPDMKKFDPAGKKGIVSLLFKIAGFGGTLISGFAKGLTKMRGLLAHLDFSGKNWFRSMALGSYVLLKALKLKDMDPKKLIKQAVGKITAPIDRFFNDGVEKFKGLLQPAREVLKVLGNPAQLISNLVDRALDFILGLFIYNPPSAILAALLKGISAAGVDLVEKIKKALGPVAEAVIEKIKASSIVQDIKTRLAPIVEKLTGFLDTVTKGVTGLISGIRDKLLSHFTNAQKFVTHILGTRFNSQKPERSGSTKVAPQGATRDGSLLSPDKMGLAVARTAMGRSNGHVMEGELRGEMEGAFGRDFSGVWLHTDTAAADAARAMQAKALTQGRHIYFDQGQFTPGSDSGRELLAHELVHTVQQRGQASGNAGRLSGESAELEARQAARRVVRTGAASTIRQRERGVLARAGDGEDLREYGKGEMVEFGGEVYEDEIKKNGKPSVKISKKDLNILAPILIQVRNDLALIINERQLGRKGDPCDQPGRKPGMSIQEYKKTLQNYWEVQLPAEKATLKLTISSMKKQIKEMAEKEEFHELDETPKALTPKAVEGCCGKATEMLIERVVEKDSGIRSYKSHNMGDLNKKFGRHDFLVVELKSGNWYILDATISQFKVNGKEKMRATYGSLMKESGSFRQLVEEGYTPMTQEVLNSLSKLMLSDDYRGEERLTDEGRLTLKRLQDGAIKV